MISRQLFLAALLSSPLCSCAAEGPVTEADVDSLEAAALAGDRSAVRTLFELRARADGAAAESIDITLGSTKPERRR